MFKKISINRNLNNKTAVILKMWCKEEYDDDFQTI